MAIGATIGGTTARGAVQAAQQKNSPTATGNASNQVIAAAEKTENKSSSNKASSYSGNYNYNHNSPSYTQTQTGNKYTGGSGSGSSSSGSSSSGSSSRPSVNITTDRTGDTVKDIVKEATTTPTPSSPAPSSQTPNATTENTPVSSIENESGVKAGAGIQSSTPTIQTGGNWRNSAAGVAISMGTATDAQKIEALEQGATAQNVGFTNPESLPEGKYITKSGTLGNTADLVKDMYVDREITPVTMKDGSQITSVKVKFSDLTPEEQAEYDLRSFEKDVSTVNILAKQPNQIGLPLAAGQGQTAGQIREEEIRKTIFDNPLIGNYAKGLETLAINPDGTYHTPYYDRDLLADIAVISFPVVGQLAQSSFFIKEYVDQANKWDNYDGSGDTRLKAGALTLLDVGIGVSGGAALGAAGRVAGVLRNALSKSDVGNIVLDIAKTPLISDYAEKTALNKLKQTTGITLPKLMDGGDGVFAKATTPAFGITNVALAVEGINQASAIYNAVTNGEDLTDEIIRDAKFALITTPLTVAGAKGGFKAATAIDDYIRTAGRAYVKETEIALPGIPLSKHTMDEELYSLNQNTQLNVYDFSRSNIRVKDYQIPQHARLPTTQNIPQSWHAAVDGKGFKKQFIVKGSTSELPGLFVGSTAYPYYLHSEQSDRVAFSIFDKGSQALNQRNPKIINLRGVEYVPISVDEVAAWSGYPKQKLLGNFKLRSALTSKYVEANLKPGQAAVLNWKDETEAVVRTGTEFTRTAKRYYTRDNRKRVPVDEYEIQKAETRQKLVKTELPKEYTDRFILRGERIRKTRGNRNYSRTNKKGRVTFSITPIKVQSVTRITQPTNHVSPIETGSRKLGTGPVTTPREYNNTMKRVFGNSQATSRQLSTPSLFSPASGYSPSPAISPSSGLYQEVARSPVLNMSPTGNVIQAIGQETRSANKDEQYKGKRKKNDDRNRDLLYFSALRTGRIDRLSIIDPSEMLGGPDISNRNRPDRIIRIQPIYNIDGKYTTKKPKGRKRA